MRLVALFLLLPPFLLASLWVPWIGLVGLVLFYYVRPAIWGIPAALAPVELLTWATMFGLLLYRARNRCSLRLPPAALAMLLLVGSAYLSAASASASPAMAAERAMVYLKCAIVGVLAANLIDDGKKLDRLLWAVVFGTFWLVKSAIYLNMTSGPDRVDAIGGQGGTANFLALMLVISLPILLLKVQGGRGWEKLLALGLLPLWFLTMVLSGSRGGFLAMVAVLFLYIWTSRRRALALLLAATCAIGLLALAPQTYKDRLKTIDSYETDLSAMGRIYLWKGAFRLANQHPLLGVGPDNFQLLSGEFIPFRQSPHGLGAHNLYMQVLAEQGYPGLLLLLVAMGLTVRGFRRARRLAPETPEGERIRLLARALELGFYGFAVHSLVMTTIGIDVMWWWMGLGAAASVLVAVSPMREGAPARPRARTGTVRWEGQEA